MTKFVRIAALALVTCASMVPSSAHAQSTAAYTRVGFDARGIAMGNALVADLSGHASPYYNPALAPDLTGQHFGLSAAYLRLDRQLQSVQFGAPLRPRAGVAIGFVHAGVSKIDGRDNSGFHTENLSTDEFAFFMAFGLRMSDRVSIGMALQLFRSDLYAQVDPVNSVGLDAGIVARATDYLSVGLVIEDLLAKFDWDTSGALGGAGKTTVDHFPRRVRLGASFQHPAGRLRVNGEYEVMLETLESRSTNVELVGIGPVQATSAETLYRASGRFRVGAEYSVTDIFGVMAGLDRVGADLVDDVSPTAGFTVLQDLGNLTVRAGYAVVLEPLATGAMHMLTMRVFL